MGSSPELAPRLGFSVLPPSLPPFDGDSPNQFSTSEWSRADSTSASPPPFSPFPLLAGHPHTQTLCKAPPVSLKFSMCIRKCARAEGLCMCASILLRQNTNVVGCYELKERRDADSEFGRVCFCVSECVCAKAAERAEWQLNKWYCIITGGTELPWILKLLW